MAYVQHRAPNFFDSSGSDRAYEGLISSLRGLGQDREDRRRQDIQDARQRAAEDFTRRQSEVAERRAGAAEARDRQKYELEISDRNRKQAGEIYDLAAAGKTGRARAQAAAGRYVDPKTGEERSIDFDPGGEQTHQELDPAQLQDPTAAPAAPPRMGIGTLLKLRPPGAPPEQPPAAGGEEDAMGGQPSGMQPRPSPAPVAPPPVGEANGAPPPSPYGGLTSSLKLAPQPPQMRTTTTTRKPSLGLPGGERVEFDPEEEHAQKLRDAADTADRLVSQASAEPDPVKRDGMLAEARRLRASIPGASAAGLRTEALQESGQKFKATESAADRASREKIAAMRKASAGGGGSGFKERALNEREFNNWADKNGVKALVPMERSLDQAAHNLESDTPLAHRDAAIQIARFARGNTPTEGEQKFLYDAIQHSIAAWPDSMIAKFKNGDLGDDMIQNLSDAVKQGRVAYAQFRQRLLDSGRVALHTETNSNLRDKVTGVGMTLGLPEQDARAQLGDKDAQAALAAKAPKPLIPEGTRKTLSTGTKVIFKGGQWQPDR